MKKLLRITSLFFLLEITMASTVCNAMDNKVVQNEKEIEKPICDKDDMKAIYDCLQENIQKKDKQLNNLYQKLMANLSIDAKERLKQSQLHWIQLKDKEETLIYSLLDNNPKDPSLYGRINALHFYLKRIESRIEDFEEYLEIIDLH